MMLVEDKRFSQNYEGLLSYLAQLAHQLYLDLELQERTVWTES
jgi:hypothetical protein